MKGSNDYQEGTKKKFNLFKNLRDIFRYIFFTKPYRNQQS